MMYKYMPQYIHLVGCKTDFYRGSATPSPRYLGCLPPGNSISLLGCSMEHWAALSERRLAALSRHAQVY